MGADVKSKNGLQDAGINDFLIIITLLFELKNNVHNDQVIESSKKRLMKSVVSIIGLPQVL